MSDPNINKLIGDISDAKAYLTGILNQKSPDENKYVQEIINQYEGKYYNEIKNNSDLDYLKQEYFKNLKEIAEIAIMKPEFEIGSKDLTRRMRLAGVKEKYPTPFETSTQIIGLKHKPSGKFYTRNVKQFYTTINKNDVNNMLDNPKQVNLMLETYGIIIKNIANNPSKILNISVLAPAQLAKKALKKAKENAQAAMVELKEARERKEAKMVEAAAKKETQAINVVTKIEAVVQEAEKLRKNPNDSNKKNELINKVEEAKNAAENAAEEKIKAILNKISSALAAAPAQAPPGQPLAP